MRNVCVWWVWVCVKSMNLWFSIGHYSRLVLRASVWTATQAPYKCRKQNAPGVLPKTNRYRLHFFAIELPTQLAWFTCWFCWGSISDWDSYIVILYCITVTQIDNGNSWAETANLTMSLRTSFPTCFKYWRPNHICWTTLHEESVFAFLGSTVPL